MTMLAWTDPGRLTSRMSLPALAGGAGGGGVAAKAPAQPPNAARARTWALAGVTSPATTSNAPAGRMRRPANAMTSSRVSPRTDSDVGRRPYGLRP